MARRVNRIADALARLDAAAKVHAGGARHSKAGKVIVRPACSWCAGTGDVFDGADIEAPRETGDCPECQGTGVVKGRDKT